MRQSERQNQRRGGAVYVALILLVLVGFTALAVDIGHARMVRSQIHLGADAIAHAAVASLHESQDQYPGPIEAPLKAIWLDEAEHAAHQVARYNRVQGEPINLDDHGFEWGHYDHYDGSFTPLTPSTPQAILDINAARVNVRYDNIQTYFAPAAFGVRTLAASAETMATVGDRVAAGSVECFLPIAVPTCLFDGKNPTEINLEELRIKKDSQAGEIETGWAHPENANASNLRDQMAGQCDYDEVFVGDEVDLNRGAIQNVLQEMADMIEGSDTFWDEDKWGPYPVTDPDDPQDTSLSATATTLQQTYEGPVMLFDGGDHYCDGGGGWNQPERIEGFAWGAIYNVYHQGAVEDRRVWMRLEVTEEYLMGTSGGGFDAGVVYQPPSRIVY